MAAQLAVPHDLLRALALGGVAYAHRQSSAGRSLSVRVEWRHDNAVAVEWGEPDAGIPTRETFACLRDAVMFLADHDQLGGDWRPYPA